MTSLQQITNNVINIISDPNNNTFTSNNIWYLPVLSVILKNLSDTAITLHSSMDDEDATDKDDVIVQSVNKIMLLIRAMTADSQNINKNINNNKTTLSHGLFFTVNQVIRLCDIINNQTYLNHALSEVEKFRSFWTRFPLSDVVTHLYYKGRYNFQRGGKNLYQARDDLNNAYKLCLSSSLNKHRILLLLIPIQILVLKLR